VSEAIGVVAEALRASMRQGRMPFLEVSSNSMAPLLRQGDSVGLAPALSQQLQRGDLITFVENGHFTTHRYWGQTAEQMLTRGDRSATFDQPWTAASLVGRAVVRRRGSRALLLYRGTGARLLRFHYFLARSERRILQAPLPARLVRRLFHALALLVAFAGDRPRGAS
jgi:hypothetical protein